MTNPSYISPSRFEGALILKNEVAAGSEFPYNRRSRLIVKPTPDEAIENYKYLNFK